MKPAFTWIHLSDLHFGHGDATHAVDQRMVLSCLKRDIAQVLHDEQLKPDAILVTGDIAFSGSCKSDDEYTRAETWLKEIAQEAQLNPSDIFTVPGNHDVQWSADRADRNVARLIENIRTGKQPLDDALEHNDDHALLKKRFTNYLQFSKHFAPANRSEKISPRLYWNHRIKSRSDHQVHLIGLNTALLSTDDHDKGKLQLGQLQIQPLSSLEPEEIAILLSHHPLRGEWLADQDNAESWTSQYAQIHLSGHVHDADSEQTRKGSGSSIIRIVAGASHGESMGSSIQSGHGYNFAAIIKESTQLKVRIWPRRWSARNREFRSDIDNSTDGQKFTDHDLILPNHRITKKSSNPQPPARETTGEMQALIEQLSNLSLSNTPQDREEVNELRTRIRAIVLAERRKARDGRPLSPGETLSNRYRLMEQIGYGGFATVWKALDLTTCEYVAVKILHGQYANDKSYRERFARGARVMSKLSHQNIVHVLQGATESDTGPYYFVMEYLGGGDFRRAVLENKLSQQKVLETILSTGNALQYAHENHCIHRDVKPQNIILCERGIARLTDFDLVHMIDSTGGTRTGAMGTVVYAPPEALTSAKDVDTRGDVYSLGMTTVFGLFGKDLPFIEIMRSRSRILNRLPCPNAVKAVLKRAIEWETLKRFRSIDEFCDALGRAFSLNDMHSRLRNHNRKTGKPKPPQDPRHPIPKTTARKVLEKLAEFDLKHRGEWLNWEENPHHRYAIEHDGRRYPVKHIISMATGLPTSNFSGGQAANKVLKKLGFNIVSINTNISHREDTRPINPTTSRPNEESREITVDLSGVTGTKKDGEEV